MHIIESLCQGKVPGNDLNEDHLIVTDDFIAVLDGVSTVNCPPIDGMAGGRFAVRVAEEIIRSFAPDVTAETAVGLLSQGLRAAVAARVTLTRDIRPPSFAMAIYSAGKKQVWRVCDCAVMIDGVAYTRELPPDAVTSEARAYVIEALLLQGKTIDQLRSFDLSREVIRPLLQEQHHFSNLDSAYGYGVIDGRSVPSRFIDVFDAARASEIVLASDGYPFVCSTLAETEERLSALLRDDPLLFRQYKSTKGHQQGNLSFDDRTYIRFNP